MVRRASLLAAVALLAACQREAVAPERRETAVAAIRFHDGAGGPALSRFSLHEVGDIVVDVSWDAETGVAGTQVLEIYSPDGAVYRDERGVAGQPLTCTLPVAGSSISRHAITGRWWAELRVAGERMPVAAAEFEIAGEPVTGE